MATAGSMVVSGGSTGKQGAECPWGSERSNGHQFTSPSGHQKLAAYGGVFDAGSLACGMVLDGFARSVRRRGWGSDLPSRRCGDHVRTGFDLTLAKGRTMTDLDPKQTVRRLIDEVMNQGKVSVLDELYVPRLAPVARQWVGPFLTSFSAVRMRIVELVAEGETVVGRFTCSGTHTGTWLGRPATGRRFTNVAEVYFFRVVDGRISRAWGLEDTADRLRQLGLSLAPDGGEPS
jgi:hypothetical protein